MSQKANGKIRRVEFKFISGIDNTKARTDKQSCQRYWISDKSMNRLGDDESLGEDEIFDGDTTILLETDFGLQSSEYGPSRFYLRFCFFHLPHSIL